MIDLVLRDSSSDQFIVVDYKTDAISAEQDLDEYAQRYADQLSTYSIALQQALDLPYRPQAELWFLACDRVWTSS